MTFRKLCFLTVLLLGYIFPTQGAHKKHIHIADAGDRYLQAWYADFNERLFYSQLPKDTLIGWEDLSDLNVFGITSEPTPDHFQILLDPDANNAPVTAQETLIHEMCHVEVSYVEKDSTDSGLHGPKWEGCMERVAAHGGLKGIW